MGIRLMWKKNSDDEAEILRAYGTSDEVRIPETVNGCVVSAVGAYCFSEADKTNKENVQVTDIDVEPGMENYLRELSGSYIKKVYLPDNIKVINNAAFYNCRKINEINIGTKLEGIGSDVFMNCTQLSKVMVRCGCIGQSGVNLILNRISSELEVHFTDAVVLYPEYIESYDEIAPAHIFGRNIAGEGFRERQCFVHGKIDYNGYDQTFLKACAEESEDVLVRMAAYRLLSPAVPEKQYADEYEEFLKAHEMTAVKYFVKVRETDIIERLSEGKFISVMALEEAIEEAAKNDWPKGAARLMEMRHKRYDKKKRYDAI